MTTNEGHVDTSDGGSRSGFDPAASAAKAREDGHDHAEVRRTVVTEALGYASACWDNLRGAGVFESDRAKECADALLAWLEEPINAGRTVHVEPGQRLVLRMTEEAWRSDGGLPSLAAVLAEAQEKGHTLVVAPSIEAYVVGGDVTAVDEPRLVDKVAQEIRFADGSHTLSAGQLAEVAVAATLAGLAEQTA